MAEWLPIETAPKDGTRVDVWNVGYGDEPRRFVDAWFSDGHWWYADGEEVWQIDPGTPGYPSVVTHWMPRPEPPK